MSKRKGRTTSADLRRIRAEAAAEIAYFRGGPRPAHYPAQEESDFADPGIAAMSREAHGPG